MTAPVPFGDPDWANSRHCSRADSGEWLCCRCKEAKLQPGENLFCQPCREKAGREQAQRDQERREAERTRWIQSIAREGLEGVPDWAHADTKSPEFQAKCRSPKLRGFAGKYSVAHGSAALLGESGRGKTTACVALARRLVADGIAEGLARFDGRVMPPALVLAKGIVWTTARALVMARRSSELGEEPALLRKSVKATLLFVDEWGSEAADRDGDLMNVVDERYSSARPTIITSGLTTAQFDEKYGTALLRRVAERGVLFEEHGV